MNAVLHDDKHPVSAAVERLVSEHGARAVLAAVAMRLLRPVPRRPATLQVAGLNDHLRRDIGLPPLDPPVDRHRVR